MNKQRSLPITSAVFTVLLVSIPAYAGGPLDRNPNDPDGVERWPNGGANIPFNVDGVPTGGLDNALGPFSYDEAVAEVIAAFQRWQSIPSATQTYSDNGPMPVDITVDNYAPFVQNLFFGGNTSDGFSPVVFDADGSIFTDLFGISGVLGFASTDTRDAAGNPIEAVCFLNGGSIVGGGGTFPVDDFLGVIVHEFGHYTGLGHTVVNGQNVALGDSSGPSPNNTYGNAPVDQTETMYPFALVGGGFVTPHRDDIAYLSFIYPAADYFATTGTIQGRILDPGGNPIRGVNVIARNVDNPFEDAVSAISGDRGIIDSPSNGDYTLNGLTPGASYTIHVDQIEQGGFSTPPIQLPGPEEFYNGANESNNTTTPDDPAEATPVTVQAGETVAGIDIVFNGLAPGELDLGDDDTVEIFPSFPITFCGETYNSVFVNSNGSVTFGAGSTDLSESVADHLAGPPRIAGVWDDLNPTAGGVIRFDETSDSITISFQGVPEFISTGANSFDITIFASNDRRGDDDDDDDDDRPSRPAGNKFNIAIGDISAVDGLTGYSCGGAITAGNEPETDLSDVRRRRRINTRDKEAIYEIFTFGETNDLAGRTLRFNGTTAFEDDNEPNDTVADATPIAAPFNSAEQFTAIDPTGADVDFYAFDADEGATLVAEVTNGQLDTVLGLYRITRTPIPGRGDDDDDDDDDDDRPRFEVSAELIASDDDGGVGLLSRIVFPISESGEYAVAVSTFPDTDFTGDGGSGGRYVLDVQSVDGVLLDLGDDASVEVSLDFSFPFQGESFGSVFVNSNGNLTFGSGDTDFSESVLELLNEQPRIAPLWDDLSPNQGGLVIADSGSDSLSVTFQNVPEFLASTTNTFTVTLSSSGAINVTYGAIAATDGIAGVTPGNGASDPGSTDLSAAPTLSAIGTTYELFDSDNPNDLSGVILDYEP